MPGRHDAPDSSRRRWAPLALDLVIACTPAAALAAAVGLAGGGYLVGRADVAACGALAGAFGLVVERLQTRSVRVRLRRERSRHRTDLRELNRQLRDMKREFAALRADLDDVRTDVRTDSRSDVRTDARTDVPGDRGPAESAESPTLSSTAKSLEPTGDGTPGGRSTVEPAGRLMIPGQVRSPIATGGIPVLAPGPSEPVRVVDLRSGRPAPEESRATRLPVLTAELADALVYAAMAEAEAAQLTRVLDLPTAPITTSPTLYVVRRGKHVA